MELTSGYENNGINGSEMIVSLSGVAKEYVFHATPMMRALAMIFPWLPIKHASHMALDGVDLSIRKGQTIGVIGRNGAGKSTLLGVICGAIAPTLGTVDVRGTVAAILELGVGFNQDLTGRENAVLYTKLQKKGPWDMADPIKFIEEFADIGEYFDRHIKTYSSGMVARLAFSCAISLNSDILVIDEALAVGDAKFQAKCLSYIKEKRRQGVTVILVTHSPEVIQRNCDWAVLVEQGKIIKEGNPREVTDEYETMLYGARNQTRRSSGIEESASASDLVADPFFPDAVIDATGIALEYKPNYNRHEDRVSLPESDVWIEDFVLESEGVRYPTQLTSGAKANLYVKVGAMAGHSRVQTGIGIYTKDGVKLYGANSLSLQRLVMDISPGQSVWAHYALTFPFATGDYFIDVGCGDHGFDPPRILDLRRRFIHIRIVADGTWDGLVDVKAGIRILSATSTRRTSSHDGERG